MNTSTRPSEYVTDTIGLVLRVERRRLGPAASAIFESVEAGTALVFIPAFVFGEILYLSERNRIRSSLHAVRDYMDRFPNCREYPMDLAVIQSASEIDTIRELHDRLIAATARLLDLELITNDVSIQSCGMVRTIW